MTTELSTRLKAFFPKGFLNSLNMREFYLGEFSNDFSFTIINSSWNHYSKSTFSIHKGDSRRSPVIATVLKPRAGDFMNRFDIIVSIPSPGLSSTITLDKYATLGHSTYGFTMKVGTANLLHTEKFEWRASRGNEIQVIHPNARGYKLVRLGQKGPGGGTGGERSTRKNGETSDGKEIVAFWGTTHEGITLIPNILSPAKRPFTYYTCGSGKTGELGERFSVVALTTALKIYSLQEVDAYFSRRAYQKL